MLWWTLKAFRAHPRIAVIQTVIGQGHDDLFSKAAGDFVVEPPVTGGATRQDSCRLGIEALARHGVTHVLIHDAARPFVAPELIDRVIAGLTTHQGAIPGLAVADTLKKASNGTIERTVDRAGLWAVQTPQGFAYEAIRAAHEKARAAGETQLTDDAAVAEFAGLDVTIVAGAPENRKMTTPDDLAEADRALNRSLTDIRTGMGVDIHPFAPGDHVMLCGVRIDHTHRLAGHSDADAALHALTDAILGAIGEGDIGTFFPPSDPQWKDAPSSIFLAKAVELVRERGGRVGNADIAILAEVPRISPHLAAMKASLSTLLGIAQDRIAIKATTAEKLGFVGRREGITAFANVTVRLPE